MTVFGGTTTSEVSLPGPTAAEQQLTTLAAQLGSTFGAGLQGLQGQVSSLTAAIAPSFGLTPSFSQIQVPSLAPAAAQAPAGAPGLGFAGAGGTVTTPGGGTLPRNAANAGQINEGRRLGDPNALQPTAGLPPSSLAPGTTSIPSLGFAPSANQVELDQLREELALSTLRGIPQLGDIPDSLDENIRQALQRLIEGQANAQGGIGARLNTAEGRIGEALGRLEGFTPERIDAVLAELESGAAPSAVERDLVTQLIGNLIEKGEGDIGRVSEEQIRLVREELGPSLGLAPGDTPLIDRGQLVAREATRSSGQLQNTLRAEEARILLSRPLERLQLALSGAVPGDQLALSALTTGLQGELSQGGLLVGGETDLHRIQLASNQAILAGQVERDRLGEAARESQLLLKQNSEQFQLGLAQTAALNRLAFLGGSTSAALGPAQVGLGFAATGLSNEAANRRAQPTQTERGGGNFSGLLGGTGALLEGAGAAFTAFSSRTVKDDIETIDNDEALAMLEALPIASWRYKGDPETHISPIAEDWHEVTGLGDGKTIDLRDMVGLQLAATKALHKTSLGLAMAA